MKVTGKYSIKPYKCSECGQEVETGTNHWGDIYPWCYVCNKPTVWECQEELPEGYEKPEPWKAKRLGDVVEIMRLSRRRKIK